MKILFFDTKNYDKDSFEKQIANYPEIEMDYLKTDLAPKTAPLAKGYDAVCAFVSSDVGAETMTVLHEAGVKLILMLIWIKQKNTVFVLCVCRDIHRKQ